ncbi:MAG TPA: outer membrane beta-barrel protein [Planctomycetota bacterium]|nr:outer membrane beta-barrel protein [Planctomycetota bacterium]
MSRGTKTLLIASFFAVAARANAQDTIAPPGTGTTTDPRDAQIQKLLERVDALEKKQQAPPAPPPGVTAPASEPAPPNPDYAPEVVPFSDGDTSWIPGNYAPAESILKWGPFTGEIRADAVYHLDRPNPVDDTISGSSEVFRSNEFQITQLGVGGDFYYKGAMARVMTQFGMYSQTTPRNDASPNRGQWNLSDAYRYISEAYGGYHINWMAGLNIQAGIFMSYVGLWSYYNFDNWTYQPSYVSSNTPWFFNGMRVQWFPFKNLKIEPWLVNGWQSYGQFNNGFGFGLQTKWILEDWLCLLGNQYYGTDTLDTPGRRRIHTDDSIMVKYFDDPNNEKEKSLLHPHAFLSRMAASFTFDYGNEAGGGVTHESQYFVGIMTYDRTWFWDNHLAFTFGGGFIKNPGRYLVLLPPINGATASSGTPYFTENPGDKFTAWDMQTTLDVMPTDNVTFRFEFCHRFANVPYFAGRGGVTPPGGNQGAPGSTVTGWAPDLKKDENRITLALMVRF